MARKSKPSTASKTAIRSKKTKRMSTPATRPDAARPQRKAPTIHKLVWRHVTCRVRHTRDYINAGWSHIEIIVLVPKNVPLPITQTGYLSHFMDEEELAKAGGPVAFFMAWLDREARSAAWAKAEFKWRQLGLFDN